MLDQVLRIFEIAPDFDLNIMKQGQDLYDVTARVLTGMRDVFKECKPDEMNRQITSRIDTYNSICGTEPTNPFRVVEDGEGGKVGVAVWREGATYRAGEPVLAVYLG